MSKTTTDGRTSPAIHLETIPAPTLRRLAAFLQALGDPDFRKIGRTFAAVLHAKSKKVPALKPEQ